MRSTHQLRKERKEGVAEGFRRFRNPYGLREFKRISEPLVRNPKVPDPLGTPMDLEFDAWWRNTSSPLRKGPNVKEIDTNAYFDNEY